MSCFREIEVCNHKEEERATHEDKVIVLVDVANAIGPASVTVENVTV